jgi:hypothetical protein
MSHPGPSAVEITLSEAERAELVRRTELPHRRSAEKARIILACADGMSNAPVARVVEKDPGKVLALVDEAWAMQSKAIKDPVDAFRFVFPMGRTIGTRGERYLQIAVNPQTKEILSAYPVASP